MMTSKASLLALLLGTGVCGALHAQTSSVLVTGLNSPMKLAFTAERNILVSEATVQPNTGRVSLVTRAGARTTLLDALPSGPAVPGNSPLGPAALVMDGRTLYIGIQEGNVLVPGATPQSRALPNPDGPASPIFSSVLKVVFNADVDRIVNPFTLSLDNQYSLADFSQVTLTNGDGQTALLELLADFPDLPLDRREVYGHVTPYGMALDAAKEFLFIADSGQNRIIKVNVNTGRWQTLVRFPRVPRVPALPTQADVDAVPTTVRFYGDDMLVSFLTGFPFAEGVAAVQSVNARTGEIRPFIAGLRTATDVAYREVPSQRPQFFVTEYRSSLTGTNPTGRLLQFDTPEPVVIADQLNGPTSVIVDPSTGDVFVTEFQAGQITQIRPRQ